MRHMLFASAAVLAFAAASSAQAEEGMWTYDNFPIARANATLGTNIDQAWLDKVRLSSVKFGGCSARRGLRRGPGDDQQPLRRHLRRQPVDPAAAIRRDRLHAAQPRGGAEMPRRLGRDPDRHHRRHRARCTPAGEGLSGQAFTQARDAETGRIESEACGAAIPSPLPGRQPVSRRPVQALQVTANTPTCAWPGRRRTAPRPSAATSTTSPSRASPSMRPSSASTRTASRPATPVHFTWNADKPTEGEPVFVTGNPGATQRLLTQAQLMTVRDVILPMDQLIALGAARPPDPLRRGERRERLHRHGPDRRRREHLQARPGPHARP